MPIRGTVGAGYLVGIRLTPTQHTIGGLKTPLYAGSLLMLWYQADFTRMFQFLLMLMLAFSLVGLFSKYLEFFKMKIFRIP